MSTLRTKSEIVTHRLCGLKHLDKALTKVSKKELVDLALQMYRDAWLIRPNDPWSRFGWAIAHAIAEINDNWTTFCSANLDEMFDDVMIQYISNKIQAPLPNTDNRKRRLEPRAT